MACPKVTLEIGVFFDGTLNNTANAQAGSGGGSYANARSNVSLLYPLYKNGERYTVRNSCGRAARKFAAIYKQGIGTTAGESDWWPGNIVGAGTGTGRTGIEARVFEACVDVGTAINRLSPGIEPEEVILDVFGFSRGAAAARYFVNCFRQGYVDYNAYYLDERNARLPEGRKIKIRYVGIFDTVAAVGSGSNDDNGSVNVHLATRQANRIFHLTAQHEYRRNFRLNHNLPGGGVARAMIGAHSDIGGGYRDSGDRVVVERTRTHSYATRASAEAARSAAVRQAALNRTAASSFWVREGWITPNERPGEGLVNQPSRIQTRAVPGVMGMSPPVHSFTTGAVLNRPWVRIGLSRVALKVMYEDAKAAAVPFLSYPTGADYVVPRDLAAMAPGYAAGGPTPTGGVARQILRNFGHCSSNYAVNAVGMGPNTGFVRGVAPNRPGRAK